MPELAIDPLMLALFVMIALPLFAVIQMFSKPKKLSDRLFEKKEQSPDRTVQRSQKASLRLDVRKELPTSRFGSIGSAIDAQLGKSDYFNDKSLQSGLKYNFSDVILILILLFFFVIFAGLFLFNLSLFVSIIAALVLCVVVPHFWLSSTIAKRQKLFLADFPDALDLVVRGIRSGLPVTEAIDSIGKEFKGPIGEIFTSIQAKIAIGQTLDEALWATSLQMPLPEFRFFIISLTIQQETGGNLGEILGKLSSMIRKRQQLKLKIKAMSSEARASAMIIGSLPFVMMGILYMVNSDYIMTLFTDPRGTILLGVGATMLSLGVGIMAKMSKFEI